ncbi:hypothetical protein H1Z61_00075 [Bacillus aquiflavi]|uniref:Lipoprotein n=1 Tax=Bacillus aquiflavi TaxID=2672567 RepID=A0A6B3VWP8_9BACI|nr:hypothetical protein [Bacillus aquiflavi]MBA4535565.1 hypothetical protein [Bacillus aquiflavi]NEY79941.1 hypothetical protein [Bacillus aquiflavi]UAC48885.1 hypothetical protein K6959_02905 [Bacillus aquiflavi]
MKRLLLLSISILIVIFLSACTGNPLQPNENNMILSIKNNANFDFYSIEISTDNTVGGISNADGSKIQKGETLRKEYIDQKDFDLEGEATFEFVLIGEEENRIPLKKITLELTTNKEYFFEIIGDSIREANLKRIE